MLANASQVLVRNEALFTEGHWLLVNPTEGHIFKSLEGATLQGFHQYFDVYQHACNLTSQHGQEFGACFDSETPV